MLDLQRGARPTDQFYLQRGQPVPHTRTVGPLRVTTWSNLFRADGTPATFRSWWIGKLQWYSGTAKCDGTRTRMYWGGQLDDGVAPRYVPDAAAYVMTQTPAELSAFRWRAQGPGAVNWDNQGGS